MELKWTTGEVRYFRLGRHALLAALKLLETKQGDAVLVPAFICRDLLAPIYAAGAIPVFYDVDRRLRPVALPEAQNVRAVLAVNYFGFPQELAPFRAYCARHNAALIEDNAHGFLSRDAAGALLGERGDLSIFSLRKTLVIPDGGALAVNKPEWRSRLEVQLPCSSRALPLGYRARYALSQIQRRTGINILLLSQKMVRLVRRFRTGEALPVSAPESESQLPANPEPHCRSLELIAKFEAAAEVTRRRTLYKRLHHLLAKEGVEPIFGDLSDGVAPYGYPFYADRNKADKVKNIAAGLGLDCVKWPDLPAAVEPLAPEHYQSARVVII
ncbi:MAG: DegT/DnrJ/EryC1/StrS family aminotransferase [Candidatus Margulisbacteria bacterium]|jgi:hypothetical protein|nr:DegT/DnrJ/EryC1/StrS family aminotransferase [Candidatus Margulisiibacteriota bacterium]